MNRYADCLHDWKVDNSIPKVPRIKCEKCNLSIEVYQTHVSVWNYTIADAWLGKVIFDAEG